MPKRTSYPKRTRPEQWTPKEKNYVLRKFKAGQMPLTSSTHIAKITGIPLGRLTRVERPNSQLVQTRIDLIRSGRGDPASPKLWALARMIDLAKTHNGKEIYAILVDEACEKNKALAALYPSKYSGDSGPYKVPLIETIWEIIRLNNLRSREEVESLQEKARKKQRKRQPNKLTREEKDALIASTVRLVNNWVGSNTPGVPVDDLQSEVIRRLTGEIDYFNPTKPYANASELEANWAAHLLAKQKKTKRRRIDYFIIDAKRSVGPFTRRGRQRRPASDEYIGGTRAKPDSLFSGNVRFSAALTQLERETFDLLRHGFNPKQIANMYGITVSGG